MTQPTANFLQVSPWSSSSRLSFSLWGNSDALTSFDGLVWSLSVCPSSSVFHQSISSNVEISPLCRCSHVSVSLVHSSASCQPHVSIYIICFVSLPVSFNRRWLTRPSAGTASMHHFWMTGWHISVHFAVWYFYPTALFLGAIHFSLYWGDCSHQSWVSTEFSLS